MCEANVYMIDKEGKEELILESVDKVIPSDKEFFWKIFSVRERR
jgi:hypothetical protein